MTDQLPDRLCVDPDSPFHDPELLQKEKEIAAEQVQGKPENIVEKIVAGKLEKFYAENVLLEQPFVKNPDLTIQDLLKQQIAKMGENMVINRFARFQIGG